MSNDFHSLGLQPQLVQTLTEKGYNAPTPIQSDLIPAMLDGKDVIGQSQTGSGKTAAFGLPMLQNIVPNQRDVQGLVIAPTRELAIQVAEALKVYGQSIKVRVLAVYGGQSYDPQIRSLKKGIDVVVGTPGRVLDLINRKILNLSKISTAILDEADEMLSMGFLADVAAILEATPQDRQTGMFSATMPKPILELADRYLHEPFRFTLGRQKMSVPTIEQRCYLINESDRLAALTRLFEVEPIVSALVFTRTRLATDQLANALVTRGYPAEMLNGDLSQEARERVLQRFRNNQIKVLVATDVAARGLDIDHVSHIFNYDMPQDPELYVHRIGRTGRAGRTGVAISLLTPRERWFLRKIEAYTKQKINLAVLPTEEEIQNQRDAQVIERMMVWLRRGRCQRERDMVTDLLGAGHDAADIAAAALKLVRAEEKQRPIEPVGELMDNRAGQVKQSSKRRKKGKEKEGGHTTSHEKGMVRLMLSRGSDDGLNVSRIVGSLAHFADIPGHCIGKIVIDRQQTYVDVPEKVVQNVLVNSGTYRIGRQRIDIELA